jgi:hypothetical protein
LAYFAGQERQAIFDSDAKARRLQAPSFSLKRLNANVVQCERSGKTALVAVAKTVDGARLIIGIDRYHFWEAPDDQLELDETDCSILMKELAALLDDGTTRLEFQTEHQRPTAAANGTAEIENPG